MAKDSKTDFDQRVRERARRLWEGEGRPPGRNPDDGDDTYLEKAREALAIEDNPKAGTEPLEQSKARARRDPAQPVEAIENQGEFPGLADQGEQSPKPPRRGE